MKIFVSWSGKTSERVARALRSFLQDVNQQIDPWLSSTELAAGVRWHTELAASLEATSFGVLCLTREALTSPWLLFEAGALSRSVREGRVCPYLIGIAPSEVQSPLNQFQSKRADRNGTMELLTSINNSMDVGRLQQERLERYFSTFWPTLEGVIVGALKDFASGFKLTGDSPVLLDILSPPNDTNLLTDIPNALLASFDSSSLEVFYRAYGFPADEIFWGAPLREVCWNAFEVARRHGYVMSLLEAAIRDREGQRGYDELKRVAEKLNAAVRKQKEPSFPN